MKKLSPKQLGDVLRERVKQSLEEERPRLATVVHIDTWTTTGIVKCSFSNGDIIWVDCSGVLQDLNVGDKIWVKQLGVGMRSQWIFDGWYEAGAGASHVPALRADTKVSEIWANDGDPQALDTDANGVMTAMQDLKFDDGAGDSPAIHLIGGSNDDTISIWLEDDATGGDSDVVVKLADAAGDSKFIIRDSGDADVASIDSNGIITYAGEVSTGNIVMDDGIGDSPSIEFVGGTNDDTASIYLDDNAVAGQSDLVIKLVSQHQLADLAIHDSTGALLMKVRADGYVYMYDRLNVAGDVLFQANLEVSTNITYDGDLASYKNGASNTVYAFHPLAAPLTSTSFDGDSFSTTAKTVIDTSAVFSAPAGIKAALVRAQCQDSGSAAGACYLYLGPTNTAGQGSLSIQLEGQVNDKPLSETGIVTCDASGDFYYQILATGAGTFDLILQIWGYWI